MGRLRYWLLAARPKTLPVAFTPLLVGGALALAETGRLHWPSWLAALLAAVAIQVGTNLHNDAADFERGADPPQRLGPQRAAAQGWLAATEVRRGAAAAFAVALLLGGYLAWIGGWPIVLLGVAAIACGYAYTGGPRPIAYTPLGELFVLAFFGLAAVAGTYYLQTLALSWRVAAAGLALGLPAAAVLLINNYRDLEDDRNAGRRTLAGALGRPASRWLFAALLLLPLPISSLLVLPPSRAWLPGLALPAALWLIHRLWGLPIDHRLNRLLAGTAQYQLLLGGLLTLGLLY
jgi:1,4-dihydroxy-2-naphthoate polyprenyltransferase